MLGVQGWESTQICRHSERTGLCQEKIAFEEMAGRPNSYFTSRWSLICRKKHNECFALEWHAIIVLKSTPSHNHCVNCLCTSCFEPLAWREVSALLWCQNYADFPHFLVSEQQVSYDRQHVRCIGCFQYAFEWVLLCTHQWKRGVVHPKMKFCHHLLTFMLFQTCRTFLFSLEQCFWSNQTGLVGSIMTEVLYWIHFHYIDKTVETFFKIMFCV